MTLAARLAAVLVAAFVAVVALFPAQSAYAAIAEGTCGDCAWTIDDSGALVIEAGNLGSNITQSNEYWPWYEYRESITSIKAKEGVALGEDPSYLFYGCSEVVSADLANLDCSAAVTMASMFEDCSSLRSLDASKWNTSAVTDMWYMFDGCSSLRSLEASGWDTSQVTGMMSMFDECTSLRSLDLSGWDISAVTDLRWMFDGCSTLRSINFSGWKTSSMTYVASMFDGCSSLRSLDLSDWDTSSVVNTSSMFYGCSSLRSINMASWDTSSVGRSTSMFYGCDALVSWTVGEDYVIQSAAMVPDPSSEEAAWWSSTDKAWYTKNAIVSDRSSGVADTYLASPDVKIFTVTFVDDDDTEISSEQYAEGTAAADIALPSNPTKEPTTELTYTFAGWDPEVADVTEDATYKATYTEAARQYTVTFVDEDGTTVIGEPAAYDYGTAAADVVLPDDPTKAPDEENDYRFAGWTPEIADVTADATYTATYEAVPPTTYFTVTFVDEDGTTVIASAQYAEGTAATDITLPEDPTKEPTTELAYTFAGWTPEIADVTEDATYTATYTEAARQYTVTFVDEDGTTVIGEPAAYDYGTAAADVVLPDDPTKASDEEFDYSFAGWTPEIADVTADATYTATYEAIPIVIIDGSWERLAGANRYQTMAAIVAAGDFAKGGTVVLASGEGFADALVASSLAGSLHAPVVLTEKAQLTSEAASVLKGLQASNVIIVGGTAAVSAETKDQVIDLGANVMRVSGSTRQDTSLKAMAELSGYKTVVIADGSKFADALSIGPWCYATGSPILLAMDGKLTEEQIAAIKASEAENALVLGGTGAVSEETLEELNQMLPGGAQRLSGKDRYATSEAIATFALSNGLTLANVGVATGSDFPDALAGAALCGSKGSPLLLATDKEEAGTAALSVIESGKANVKKGYIFGGKGSVSEELEAALQAILQ